MIGVEFSVVPSPDSRLTVEACIVDYGCLLAVRVTGDGLSTVVTAPSNETVDAVTPRAVAEWHRRHRVSQQ